MQELFEQREWWNSISSENWKFLLRNNGGKSSLSIVGPFFLWPRPFQKELFLVLEFCNREVNQAVKVLDKGKFLLSPYQLSKSKDWFDIYSNKVIVDRSDVNRAEP